MESRMGILETILTQHNQSRIDAMFNPDPQKESAIADKIAIVNIKIKLIDMVNQYHGHTNDGDAITESLICNSLLNHTRAIATSAPDL